MNASGLLPLRFATAALVWGGCTRSTIGYDPPVDPADFTAEVTNPYFPLPAEATWTYRVTTHDGEVHTLVVEVSGPGRTVLGVDTTELWETLHVDGAIEERTMSWFAESQRGDVWMFGELDEGYDSDGQVKETSTWEAGVDGAKPGIITLAEPQYYLRYRLGFLEGELEEWGHVVSQDATIEVPAGSFEDVRLTESWSDLEAGVVARKYYAPSVGFVLEEPDASKSDVIELVETSLPVP